MLLRKNDKIRNIKISFLLIGVISLFLCLFPFQENTGTDFSTFTTENVLQDSAPEDLGASYLFLRSKPAKRFFKHIARDYISFIKLQNDIFSLLAVREDVLVWQKPTYYQFLFRYTLF